MISSNARLKIAGAVRIRAGSMLKMKKEYDLKNCSVWTRNQIISSGFIMSIFAFGLPDYTP
jgi:hypothetical protein